MFNSVFYVIWRFNMPFQSHTLPQKNFWEVRFKKTKKQNKTNVDFRLLILSDGSWTAQEFTETNCRVERRPVALLEAVGAFPSRAQKTATPCISGHDNYTPTSIITSNLDAHPQLKTPATHFCTDTDTTCDFCIISWLIRTDTLEVL